MNKNNFKSIKPASTMKEINEGLKGQGWPF